MSTRPWLVVVVGAGGLQPDRQPPCLQARSRELIARKKTSFVRRCSRKGFRGRPTGGNLAPAKHCGWRGPDSNCTSRATCHIRRPSETTTSHVNVAAGGEAARP